MSKIYDDPIYLQVIAKTMLLYREVDLNISAQCQKTQNTINKYYQHRAWFRVSRMDKQGDNSYVKY